MVKAEKGDLIRIVNAVEGEPYDNGDIFEVTELARYPGDVFGVNPKYDEDLYIEEAEYEIHRKAGEEEVVEWVNEGINPQSTSEHIGKILSTPKGSTISYDDFGQTLEEIIAGVGPDAPIETNEQGAKQSASPYRMDLIDAKALLKIAQVHKQGGDKYGDTNWHGIPVNDHLNHALVHVYAHLAGDTSDEHLAHAATRMIFALALQLKEQRKTDASTTE